MADRGGPGSELASLPHIPASVSEAITAYGDARADGSDTRMALFACIVAIRRWGATLSSASSRLSPHEVRAWAHEEDPARVISAAQKAQALRDGGASASSTRAYSVALGAFQVQAKPYAYEFGRSNGDGTYSVVIERGEMVEVSPRRWEHAGPPRGACKDHPVKPLYEHAAAAQADAEQAMKCLRRLVRIHDHPGRGAEGIIEAREAWADARQLTKQGVR